MADGFGTSRQRDGFGGHPSAAERVALARALTLEPHLLLPDAITREGIQERLLKIQQERRRTMVVVTLNTQDAGPDRDIDPHDCPDR